MRISLALLASSALMLAACNTTADVTVDDTDMDASSSAMMDDSSSMMMDDSSVSSVESSTGSVASVSSDSDTVELDLNSAMQAE